MTNDKQYQERIWFAKDNQSRWQTAYNCAYSLLGNLLGEMSIKELAEKKKEISDIANYFARRIAGKIKLEFNKIIDDEFTIDQKIEELKKLKKMIAEEEKEINEIEF